MTNQRLDRRWLVVFLIFFAVLLAIFVAAYLRLIPTRLADIPYYDTAGHFILYGILAALLHLALNRRSIAVASVRVPLAAALAIAFAIGEEFVQRFRPTAPPTSRTSPATSWASSFSYGSRIASSKRTRPTTGLSHYPTIRPRLTTASMGFVP